MCATTLGFADFHGRDMNAWIDRRTYRDENDGMAGVSDGAVRA